MTLRDALDCSSHSEAEQVLVDWVFADRELGECREILNSGAMTLEQATILYHWLFMIELGIARRASTGRRWLDQNSQFRLALGGMLLAIAREFPEAPTRIYGIGAPAPLPLEPEHVISLIREYEQQVVSRRKNEKAVH